MKRYQVDNFSLKFTTRGSFVRGAETVEGLLPVHIDEDWHMRVEKESAEDYANVYLIEKSLAGSALSLSVQVPTSVFENLQKFSPRHFAAYRHRQGWGVTYHTRDYYADGPRMRVRLLGDQSGQFSEDRGSRLSERDRLPAIVDVFEDDKKPEEYFEGMVSDVEASELALAGLIERQCEAVKPRKHTSIAVQTSRLKRRIQYRLASATSNLPLVVSITGRSGSGKTTLAENVMDRLDKEGISSVTLSTDDYNRGRSGLRALFGHDDHTNWDAHHVYDTLLMARHLQELKAGRSIPKHGFNFAESEPHELAEGDRIEPAQVIIIEGIMANSPNLAGVTDLDYLMPTPLATCIGRRVLRDLEQNRTGAVASSPEELLKYQLEIAEPEYLSRLQS